MYTVDNRAYLATVLRTSAQILLRRTSDTLGTLGDIAKNMMMKGDLTIFDKCPGAANIRTPTIKIKKCPECGEEVEIFSDEMQVKCGNCEFTVYNDLQSCLQWCRYAKECVGEELYKKLKKKEEVE